MYLEMNLTREVVTTILYFVVLIWGTPQIVYTLKAIVISTYKEV